MAGMARLVADGVFTVLVDITVRRKWNCRQKILDGVQDSVRDDS